jgi:hypothetical protein
MTSEQLKTLINGLELKIGELPAGDEKNILIAAVNVLKSPLPKLAEIARARENSCNRHDDCAAADARARDKGRQRAEHCYDECCEECFGN